MTLTQTPGKTQTGIPATACTQCSFRSLTPTAACPLCGGTVETRTLNPQGAVWSHTLVHLPHADMSQGYRLVYVDLDNGPRILCRQAPTDPAPTIGDRVAIRQAGQDHFTISEVTR